MGRSVATAARDNTLIINHFNHMQERYSMNSSVPFSTVTDQSIQALGPIFGRDMEVDSIARSIDAHHGMFALKRFGEQLRRRALDGPSLQVFFASTGEFFREVPGGILALAL